MSLREEYFAGDPIKAAGVHVGGAKGFHWAVISNRAVIACDSSHDVEDVVAAFRPHVPQVVAVNTPRTLAADGVVGRECDRIILSSGLCRIRLTPDPAVLFERGHESHLRPIWQGLDLYRALEAEGWWTIECCPTASWTVWGGRRGTSTHARWSAAVLWAFALEDVPSRLDQQSRDALGAALTGTAFACGGCTWLHEGPWIPTPRRGSGIRLRRRR
jgi:predicted nuclease with RNAse H fold